MGLNIRRSIKIGKHTRLNLSKSGAGISTGVKGARVSIGPRGVRKTIGIPGTGIYYTEQSSLHNKNVYKKPNKPLSAAGRFEYKFAAIASFVVAAFFFLCGMPIMPIGIILWIGAIILAFAGVSCLKRIKAKVSPTLGNYLLANSTNPDNSSSSNESVADFINRTNAEVEVKYDFLTFKVAGVTFKNGRKYRQTILRKIKFQDPPFDQPYDLSIRPYDFEDEQAYGIYANDEQIGNVPSENVQYLKDNWNRRDAVTAIHIYGGGKNEDGEKRNYGAEITIRFNKKVITAKD